MLTMLNSRQAAKDLAGKIHKWRQENIKDYNATSWANENLSDKDFDALYKHQINNLWYVPIPEDMRLEVKTIESLPKGWRVETKAKLIK